jgi:hypothetical protein
MGSNDKVEVTIGETNVDAATSAASATRHTVEAKRFLKHPLYDYPLGKANDIALVYLPTNAVRSANVGIGYLYLNDPSNAAVFTAAYYNRQPKMFGWGQTGQTAGLSSTLQHAQASIITLGTCGVQYGFLNTNQICTAPISSSSPQVIVSCFI